MTIKAASNRLTAKANFGTWIVPAGVFLAIIFVILMWPERYNFSRVKPLNNIDTEFEQRLSLSSQLPVKGFYAHYRVVSDVPLRVPISNLSNISVTDQYIIVVDSLAPNAFLMRRDGTLIAKLGGPGRSPGEYIAPVDVDSSGENIAIADFSEKRVNVYGPDGRFQSSFTYGPQGFSAGGIILSKDPAGYVLIGNRWPTIQNPGPILLFHLYDEHGTFKRSFFPLPQPGSKLKLAGYDQPVRDRGPLANNKLFMFPWDPTLYELKSDGTVKSTDLSSSLVGFVPPRVKLPDNFDLQSFHRWQYAWTPIVGLASTAKSLVIETQCFCPSPYKLYLLDKRNKVTFTANSNLLLKGSDGEDTLLFIRDTSQGGEHSYELISVVPN